MRVVNCTQGFTTLKRIELCGPRASALRFPRGYLGCSTACNEVVTETAPGALRFAEGWVPLLVPLLRQHADSACLNTCYARLQGQAVLQVEYQRTVHLVEQHRGQIVALAHELMRKNVSGGTNREWSWMRDVFVGGGGQGLRLMLYIS
jgi:hypothetical protein